MDNNNFYKKYDNLESLKENSNDELIVFYERGTLTFKLNRPKKKNSMTGKMLNLIINLLEKAKTNDNIKLIYFTAIGEVFSSGNDFNNFSIMTFDELIVDFEKFISYLITYPKVLIAGVNGMCIGVSFTMLALFDIVLASDAAFFQVPFIQTHQTPEGCSSYLFPLYLGKGIAGHLLLNGGPLTAKEAKEIGFVSRMFESESFEKDAFDYVLKTAEHSVKSLTNIKHMINRNFTDKLVELNKYECKQLRASWDNPAFKNIIKKFVKNAKF
jgi:enoyl-CoA hydratase/carnithine racemase